MTGRGLWQDERALLAAITIAFALLHGDASLAGPAVTLSGGCAEADLSGSVQKLLGDSVAQGEGWSAMAFTHQDDDGLWVLDLEIVEPDGARSSRTFSSESCTVVVRAAAFVVAAAVDPAIEISDPEAEPAPPPSPEPASVPQPAPAPEPALISEPAPERVPRPEATPPPDSAQRPQPDPPVRARSPSGAIRAGAGVMGGALPGAATSFTLVGALLGPHWRAELTALVRLPTQKSSAQFESVGGRLGHWAVGARGCGVPSIRRTEFTLCGGLEAGQVYGRGFGFEGARSMTVPWAAALLAPGIAFAPVPRLAVVLEAQLGVPFNRAQLVIEQLDTLHTVGPVFGRGIAGLEVRLP